MLEIVIIKGLAVLIGVLEFKNRGVIKLVNKLEKIEFKIDEHVAVMGRTRHGKTFATTVSAGKHNGAVLFFNTQLERNGLKDFTIFELGKHTLEQFKSLVDRGRKINWIPPTKPVNRDKQVCALVDFIYEELGETPLLCIWDETHLYKREAKDQLVRLATTGLRWNHPCVFLTQRPAMMENNLLSQSTRKIIFQLDDVDYSYLKEKGWNIDQLVNMTSDKYLFVDHDGRNLKGAFKIKG